METIENRTFDEIAVGDAASADHVLTLHDLQLFATVSGNVSPYHIDEEFARQSPSQGVVGPGLWGASLLSGLLGARLPGPGTRYVSQSLRFGGQTRVGDCMSVSVRVTGKDAADRTVRLDCRGVNQHGEEIFAGEAVVIAPEQKLKRSLAALPRVAVHDPYRAYRSLIALTADKPPARTAVVHPCDTVSLGGALEAARAKLIEPVLIGPAAKIRTAAGGADLSGVEIVDVPHSHAAAEQAVALARAGRVQMLMKGALHTDELMRAVIAKEGGLRTARRVSHAFVMDVPAYPKPLFLTDAAVNIAPDLAAKADIVQNAIDMASVLGIERPKVALLSAVESVNPAIPSTLDAAALCKMADRGQITGGVLDGPLAFDNAISAEAARIKGIASPVAGVADILVVPDLESGNMLFKQLAYLAGATAAGVVLGARVPIVLTSRADGELARTASCAVGMLLAHHRIAGGAP